MGTRKSNTGLIVGIAAGAVVFLGLIGLVVYLLVADDEEPSQPQAQVEEGDENIEAPDLGVGGVPQKGAVVAQNAAGNKAGDGSGTAVPGATNNDGANAKGDGEQGENAAKGDGENGGEGSADGDGSGGDGDAKAKAAAAKKDDDDDKKRKSRSSRSSRSKKKDDDDDDKKSKSSSKSSDDDDDDKKKSKSSSSSGKSLSKSDVQRVIRKNFGKVRTCSRGADKKGKLKIRFTIKGSGRVSGVRVASSSFKGTRVGACVVKVVKGFKFPAYGGKPIPVTYPFHIN